MGKVKDKLKGLVGKVDKKALSAAIALMLMSWTALPVIYYLLVRNKRKASIEPPHANEKAEEILEVKEND